MAGPPSNRIEPKIPNKWPLSRRRLKIIHSHRHSVWPHGKINQSWRWICKVQSLMKSSRSPLVVECGWKIHGHSWECRNSFDNFHDSRMVRTLFWRSPGYAKVGGRNIMTTDHGPARPWRKYDIINGLAYALQGTFKFRLLWVISCSQLWKHVACCNARMFPCSLSHS